MALLIKRNSKERDYRLEWHFATFVCLKTVTSCLYVHTHLLKCWKIRLMGGPQFSAFLRAYKPYARGEGVKLHVRFLNNVDHMSWQEIRM